MLAGLAALLTGCGTVPDTSGPAPQAPPAGTPFLATAFSTPAGTWAVAVMGGSVAAHNNFWQLFVRPTGGTKWALVTPPGVADNGGLVLAGAGQSVVAAVRPSQYLTFTPLATTSNAGHRWSPAGPLDAHLAGVPDALAAAPRSGQLLALLPSAAIEAAAPGYARWHTIVRPRGLAATPAGQRCGLLTLTAAAFTPSGVPLLAGACAHPGIAGIFAAGKGTWQQTGPVLPAALAREPVTVLRLARTATGLVLLLRAGRAPATSLLAAWSPDARQWALSAPLRLGSVTVTSASFGLSGSCIVLLDRSTAAAIGAPQPSSRTTARWQSLPVLPVATATLAPAPAGGYDALAVHRSRLTIWRLSPGSASWRTTQVINVPIQYGSSG